LAIGPWTSTTVELAPVWSPTPAAVRYRVGIARRESHRAQQAGDRRDDGDDDAAGGRRIASTGSAPFERRFSLVSPATRQSPDERLAAPRQSTPCLPPFKPSPLIPPGPPRPGLRPAPPPPVLDNEQIEFLLIGASALADSFSFRSGLECDASPAITVDQRAPVDSAGLPFERSRCPYAASSPTRH